mgnify:CR=1 FL=1
MKAPKCRFCSMEEWHHVCRRGKPVAIGKAKLKPPKPKPKPKEKAK